MLSLPKISVITPSFNQGKYICETIESVVSQNYPNLEYIIIDGGSSDDSESIIKGYDRDLAYWVSEPDRGQSHAINKGFSRATGDILCWLNSDDQFAPDTLWSVAVAFMTSKADMVAGICEVYEDGNLVHRHLTSCANDSTLPLNDMLDLDKGWNAGQFFYQPEVFFTRELWARAGGHVREDCYYSMDYELWCRFALNQAKLHVIGTPLVHFRQHADQKTADPTKFKQELIEVRDNFCLQHNLTFSGSNRPEVNWGKKLKVALVNNLGFLYGAGIAQMRIAGAFELAGHEVGCFDLLSQEQNPEEGIIKEVDAFNPDIVIFGNIHDNDSVPVQLLSSLEHAYPCYWLTHDFWLITGRCGYFENCAKYIAGCDANCPTATIYPALAPNKIADAWQAKHDFLRQSNNLTVLANSAWSKQVHDRVLERCGQTKSQVIRLGVPSHQYRPLDRQACRQKLGIFEREFVLFFSVSSLSDSRKGAHLLLEALQQLTIPNLVLLTVGRLDVPFEVGGARLVSLGYVKETSAIVEAMNAANLYVGPSLEETFGQVFMEAAMCGLPSVGFDCTGVKDAIVQNITGLKVAEISANGLSQTIQCLFDSSELRKRLEKTSRAYAVNEFSIERSFASFFNVLDEIGLIDKLGVAHKLSFSSTSRIIEKANRGWRDYSFAQKALVVCRRCIVSCIDLLPTNLRARIVRSLPDSLAKFLIRVLYQ